MTVMSDRTNLVSADPIGSTVTSTTASVSSMSADSDPQSETVRVTVGMTI